MSNNYQHGGRMGLKCIPSHFSPWTESAAFLSKTQWIGGICWIVLHPHIVTLPPFLPSEVGHD